jgi:DNA polymerase IV
LGNALTIYVYIMQRIILHIDFDSFFASVEQQYHPEYRNKPIGVTATNGRTCIIAASREAKKKGVKSPSNTYYVKNLCPDIVFTQANFTLYWEISKKFITICKDYSPFVEIFSLDEVFMDVTKTAHLFGGVDMLIANIKKRLHDEVGEYITASFGISHNKLLAKLASGLKKPNGIVRITPEQVEGVYKIAKLTDICGIGEKIHARLNSMGIYTLSQLKKTPLGSLIAEFGIVEGTFLKNVGLGTDSREVVPYYDAPPVKSIGRQYCLPHNEYNHRVVSQNIYELCEEVMLKMRKLHMKARRVGISLYGSTHSGGEKLLGYYINTAPEMFRICLLILHNQLHTVSMKEAFIEGYPTQTKNDYREGYVRRIGVWVSYIKEEHTIPWELFDIDSKKHNVTKTIDALNEKFGDHTIRNGFLLYADKLTTVPNGFGSDRYEKTKFAKESAELF